MLDAITAGQTVETVTAEGTTMGTDEFLKLFVAQLENQDPLDPLDNSEFTTQLAQFSSLEQLLEINDNLENSQSMQSTINNSQSVAYLDREITAVGDQITLTDGSAEINYSLDGDATEVTIGIYDYQDNLVKSISLGEQAEGTQQFVWDGTDSNGLSLADGKYIFAVAASGLAGDVEATGYITGRVDSISYDGGVPVFYVDGVEINQEDIQSINK